MSEESSGLYRCTLEYTSIQASHTTIVNKFRLNQNIQKNMYAHVLLEKALS